MGNDLSIKRLPALLFTLALLFFCIQPAQALEVPSLKGRVNDYAGILSPATVYQLDDVLKKFEAAESTQIVVLTVTSLEGVSLEDFSLRVVEAWKLGQKKLDNGALLLIAKNDHKLRIEVGYGLEGKLTDLVSGRIIQDIITPRFKEGNFDQGVTDGIAAMIAAAKGEFSNNESSQKRKHNHIDPGTFFIFAVIFFSILGRILSRVPLISAGIGALIAPAFGALILGIGGISLLFLALLGFILGLIMAGKAHTGGGFFSGGFGGSGGSGGDSFGGFSGGGGSFGGGGASGSW
jgi:uncharacterized protein